MVYYCPFCKFQSERFSVGRAGTGRGYGLRIGSIGTGQVAKHMNAEHKDAVAATFAKAQEVYESSETVFWNIAISKAILIVKLGKGRIRG